MSRPSTRVSKEERLLNLLAALRGTERGLSKSDVRRLVHGYAEQTDEAFERMFERDKDSLRALGVPLLTTVSPVHQSDIAYKIGADADEVAELTLTLQESAVLAAAAGLWRDASLRAPAQRGLTKLRGLAGGATNGEHDLDGAPSLGLAQPGPAFGPILAALEQGRAVQFSYRAASTGETSTRLVDPWRLAARGRSWYLVGHDRDRGAPRVFHLSRIRGAVSAVDAGERTPPPDDLDVDTVLTRRTGQRVTGLLGLAPGRGGLLRRHGSAVEGGAEHHGVLPEGWGTVSVTTANLESLAGAVAAVGDGALVLDPPDLADAVVRRLTHLADVPVAASTAAAEAPRPARPTHHEVAEDRLARLLALVLHLHEQGDATVAELAAHFGVTEQQIIADVDLLWVTGAPGYQHDDLIDFSVSAYESGIISLANDQGLAHPLRLTTDEAVLLLAALGPLRAVAATVGLPTRIVDELTVKLERAAGSASDVARAVDVAVPGADPVALTRARESLDSGRRLRLTYVSAADRWTERDVDPRSLVHEAGDWLLSAWCLRAGGPRTFRVDRIISAEVLDVPADEHPWPATSERVGEVGEEVVLEVASVARWFAETVPSVALEDLDEAGVRVRLRVADDAWFVSAVLGLGEDVLGVGPEPWARRVRDAATAALAGYARR